MSTQKVFDAFVTHFEQSLNKGKYDSYMPILKNAFMPYILNSHQTVETADVLFTHEITREDIINAGVFYVDNTVKVTSVAAIERFLTVIGMFTKTEILAHYPQSTLALIPNFQDLYPNILERCGKKLKDPLSKICLSQEEYEKVVDYFKTAKNLSHNQVVVKICIQLMLLYGFKLESVAALKPSDIIEDRRLLRRAIPNQNYNFLLDIPYSLATEIMHVTTSCTTATAYLLHLENGQPLSSASIGTELKEIGKRIGLKISSTRFSKYGCVNLLLSGVPVSDVEELTGLKSTQLKDCQNYVSYLLSDNTNRFLNSRLRNMKAYDDFS